MELVSSTLVQVILFYPSFAPVNGLILKEDFFPRCDSISIVGGMNSNPSHWGFKNTVYGTERSNSISISSNCNIRDIGHHDH